MSLHNISFADILFAGRAYYARFHNSFTTRSPRGLPVNLPIYVDYGAPIIGDADGVSASQTINTTALINGALASGGVATFDVPRNIVAAWTNTAVLTVTGTDVYGETIREVSASGTSLTGKKAFKTVTSVTSSVSITSATVGTGDVLGLPYRIDDKNQISIRFNGGVDAATIVVGDTTTATGTTGDVRGTIDPAGTLNGTSTLAVIFHKVTRTTKEGAFGITQFGG